MEQATYTSSSKQNLENKKAPILILPDRASHPNSDSEEASNAWGNKVNYQWCYLRLPLQHSGVSLDSLHSSHMSKSSLKGSSLQGVES